MPKTEQQKVGVKAMLILLLGVMVLATFALGALVLFIWVPLTGYISEKPFPIEHIMLSVEKEAAISLKVEDFFYRDSHDTLTLDEDELTHLIRSNKKMKEYGVDYKLSIDSGYFNLRSSIPAKKVKNHFSGLIRFLNIKGYINAEIEGKLHLIEGRLKFVSTRSHMNGKPAHFTFLGKRTHVDLIDFLENRDLYYQSLEKIESISLSGKKLWIIKK